MKPFSVSQLNEYIAKKLRDDYNLRNVPIEGEISSINKSGPHIYFSLKDNNSIIKCAIWAGNIKNIDLKLLENGKKVDVIGDISPYARGGSYSLSVRFIEAVGEGDIMAEFNRVKELLKNEGLFDDKYKKTIPSFPYRIGVITSNTGAAVEDIKRTVCKKNNITDIVIFPTLVQGIGAVESIISNINRANKLSKDGFTIDTLIVGRGGGAPEDLIAFNDESLARTIFASDIPIISAVGHESDFTIADFVADYRAATPTAAAEYAVMDTYMLKDDIEHRKSLLTDSLKTKIESERGIVRNITELLNANIKAKIFNQRSALEKALIIINENNPQNIFGKGYSAVIDCNESVISDINLIEVGEEYSIRMKNGIFTAKATGKERF